jgi:hypothetical protein
VAGDRRITLHIGPAPSAAVRAWAQNRLALIAATRTASTLSTNADALDLLETFLGLWLIEVERGDTFDWTHQVDPDVMLLVGKYWIDLGRLPVEERDAMGVPRLEPEADSITDVVVRGMVDGLRAAGPKGEQLLERLPDQ